MFSSLCGITSSPAAFLCGIKTENLVEGLLADGFPSLHLVFDVLPLKQVKEHLS